MPTKTELDATDRRILRILSQDGRASYQAVADEVGLSRPAIMERVKRLEGSPKDILKTLSDLTSRVRNQIER